ncbi:SDR family NAD(P)-dependent oxidoreductase [Stenotrophomonas mori]|uniref:SDR family NAD(P)-dependent oxidoreductase n=1 Tax=Stenotrophomonas mori TaxID=2871096 RepID=A0ABT0SGF8_9GAMM|nr:SDR family NAD(P)-dependent oxidoreductase [Stenotrophomonas mori]MCL7714201.1 SDR family NAD(P)-dependent oxidoreductase [Stenotrophomonas mori]
MSGTGAGPRAGDARLQGRVVLVAGAAGGLGAAASQACAAAGATVVLLGRKVARLNRIYDSVARAGAEPLLYPLDLEGAAPDDYAVLAERLGTEVGRLDGVLHCAADFAGLTPFALGDPAAFARALHVNLTARAWLTQACLPLLKQREDAAVVFALDDPQRVGQAYWGGYGVAQYGLRGLLDSLHNELRNTPVRVSGLQPRPMRTALRARAFAHDIDHGTVDPGLCADACVQLLAAEGARWRGQVKVLRE